MISQGTAGESLDETYGNGAVKRLILYLSSYTQTTPAWRQGIIIADNWPVLGHAPRAPLHTHLILGDRSHALHDPRLVEPDDVVQSPLRSPVWARRRVIDIVENVRRRRQKLLGRRAVRRTRKFLGVQESGMETKNRETLRMDSHQALM